MTKSRLGLKRTNWKLSAQSAFAVFMAAVGLFTLLPRVGVALPPTLFWALSVLLAVVTLTPRLLNVVTGYIRGDATLTPWLSHNTDGPVSRGEGSGAAEVADSRAILLIAFLSWSGWIIAGFFHFGGFPIPPNYDAVHHINQIANIWRYNSLSLEAIYGNVSTLAFEPMSAFYPHGTHLLASGSAWIFNDPVRGVAFFYFVLSQVLYPFGLYLMVRSFGVKRFWSLLTCVFGASIGLLPYGPISWGGVPILAGIVGLSFGIAWMNSVHVRSGVVMSSAENEGHRVFRDVRLIVGAAAVVVGIGVIHPTAGLLLLTYFLILQARDKERRLWWKLSAVCLLVLSVVFPRITFLPGAQSVRRLGDVDPSVGDTYQQVGQTLLLAPNSPFSYWHLVFLPVIGVVFLFSRASSRVTVSRSKLVRGRTEVPNFRTSQFEAGILFVSYIWLLHISALLTSHESLNFLSWPTALWYRQIARTSYHLPMAAVLVVVVVVLAGERLLEERSRPTSRFGFVRTSAAALVMMIPVVGGLVTVRNHSSAFLDIGPISDERYSSAIQELELFQEESGSDDLFLISDFDSGISLLSVGLGIPSSAEPYGRENVTGGVHSLIASNASLQDFSSFLWQWGDSIVVTNSGAPSSALSEEFVGQSGMFERVFEADGVVGWKLGNTAVRLFTDSSSRTDLYEGRVLSMSADGVIRVVVESLNAESVISTTFDVLQPTCELQEWDIDVSTFANLEVSSIPIDSGVRLRVSGQPPVGASEYQLLVVSNGCQILGDTGAIKALVSVPVAEMR